MTLLIPPIPRKLLPFRGLPHPITRTRTVIELIQEAAIIIPGHWIEVLGTWQMGEYSLQEQGGSLAELLYLHPNNDIKKKNLCSTHLSKNSL